MESEKNFRLIAEQFLQSDVNIIELSNSFTELIVEAQHTSIDVNNLLECMHQYLSCIIGYAEDGTAPTRSATLHQLCNKICTAVDQLKIKHDFIKNMSIHIFEFIFGQPPWIAKEILRMFSAAIQFSDKSVRSEVIQEKGPYYLGRLLDELPFGDFEFQLIIVETLFRICTKEELKNMLTVNFLTEELRDALFKIDTDKFDLTSRSFLNLLNEVEKHVVSILCNKVTFDDNQLQEPPELASFEGMWVDFNVKAASVTLFINNEAFNEDSKWEMITIFPDNIAHVDISYVFNETRKKKEGIAKFILKGPGQLCYAAAQHKLKNCRILMFYSLEVEKFREIFNQIFPKIHKKVKQTQRITNTHQRAYKPLDIMSVKSGTTIYSVNNTIDTSLAYQKRITKSGEVKSDTLISTSSRTRTISSKKSISTVHHEQGDKCGDVSLISSNLSILEKNRRSRKNSRNFDKNSSYSNLSVLAEIETRTKSKETYNMETYSDLEKMDVTSYQKHKKIKHKPFTGYGMKFISSLIDMEDNEKLLHEDGPDVERGERVSRLNSKFPEDEVDSTNLTSALYVDKLLRQDDELSIASNVFHSIEEIDSDDWKEKIQKRSELKKQETSNKTVTKLKALKNDNCGTTDKVILSSLENNLSETSPDDNLDSKKKKGIKIKINKQGTDTKKNNSEPNQKKEKSSSLFVNLSPDLFTLPSVELENDVIVGNNVSIDSITKIKHKSIEERSFRGLLRKVPSSLDRARDCQPDEFDMLKLKRSKVGPAEYLEDEQLAEPQLIEIPQKSQNQLYSQTEIFETALTHLNHQETPEIPPTGKTLGLFQDISQDFDNYKSGSDDNAGEETYNSNEEFISKIKILSNIKIKSPMPLLQGRESSVDKIKTCSSQEKESFESGIVSEKNKEVSKRSMDCPNTPLRKSNSEIIVEDRLLKETEHLSDEDQKNATKISCGESQFSETQEIDLQTELHEERSQTSVEDRPTTITSEETNSRQQENDPEPFVGHESRVTGSQEKHMPKKTSDANVKEFNPEDEVKIPEIISCYEIVSSQRSREKFKNTNYTEDNLEEEYTKEHVSKLDIFGNNDNCVTPKSSEEMGKYEDKKLENSPYSEQNAEMNSQCQEEKFISKKKQMEITKNRKDVGGNNNVNNESVTVPKKKAIGHDKVLSIESDLFRNSAEANESKKNKTIEEQLNMESIEFHISSGNSQQSKKSYSKYNENFISTLIDIGEEVALDAFEKNSQHKSLGIEDVHSCKPEALKIEADSTTVVSYSKNELMQIDKKVSHIFESVEDFNDKMYGTANKKNLIKNNENRIGQVTSTFFEKCSSHLFKDKYTEDNHAANEAGEKQNSLKWKDTETSFISKKNITKNEENAKNVSDCQRILSQSPSGLKSSKKTIEKTSTSKKIFKLKRKKPAKTLSEKNVDESSIPCNNEISFYSEAKLRFLKPLSESQIENKPQKTVVEIQENQQNEDINFEENQDEEMISEHVDKGKDNIETSTRNKNEDTKKNSSQICMNKENEQCVRIEGSKITISQISANVTETLESRTTKGRNKKPKTKLSQKNKRLNEQETENHGLTDHDSQFNENENKIMRTEHEFVQMEEKTASDNIRKNQIQTEEIFQNDAGKTCEILKKIDNEIYNDEDDITLNTLKISYKFKALQDDTKQHQPEQTRTEDSKITNSQKSVGATKNIEGKSSNRKRNKKLKIVKRHAEILQENKRINQQEIENRGINDDGNEIRASEYENLKIKQNEENISDNIRENQYQRKDIFQNDSGKTDEILPKINNELCYDEDNTPLIITKNSNLLNLLQDEKNEFEISQKPVGDTTSLEEKSPNKELNKKLKSVKFQSVESKTEISLEKARINEQESGNNVLDFHVSQFELNEIMRNEPESLEIRENANISDNVKENQHRSREMFQNESGKCSKILRKKENELFADEDNTPINILKNSNQYISSRGDKKQCQHEEIQTEESKITISQKPVEVTENFYGISSIEGRNKELKTEIFQENKKIEDNKRENQGLSEDLLMSQGEVNGNKNTRKNSEHESVEITGNDENPFVVENPIVEKVPNDLGEISEILQRVDIEIDEDDIPLSILKNTYQLDMKADPGKVLIHAMTCSVDEEDLIEKSVKMENDEVKKTQNASLKKERKRKRENCVNRQIDAKKKCTIVDKEKPSNVLKRSLPCDKKARKKTKLPKLQLNADAKTMDELLEDLHPRNKNQPDKKNALFRKKEELKEKIEPRSPIEIQYKKCIEKLDEPLKVHSIVTLDFSTRINNDKIMSKVDDSGEYLTQNSRNKTVGKGTSNIEESGIEQNTRKDNDNSPPERIIIDDSKFCETKNLPDQKKQQRENLQMSGVFDEVEKSLSILFGDNKDESIGKPGELVSDKIILDKAITKNITFETSNIVSASVGMLKRGRKLYNHENEEENYLNFTIGQKNMELIQDAEDKSLPILDNLPEYQTKNRKKYKNPSGLGKKNRKSLEKFNEISYTIKKTNKKDSLGKLSRSKRHDAIIARAIERLKTPRTRTNDPFHFSSKNISGEKYKLDFSSFKERMKERSMKYSPRKKSRIEIEFQNTAGDELDKIVEDYNTAGQPNERNGIMENHDEEIEETLKIIMRNVGLLCQKISNGTLKKPGPSTQKKLLAASKLLMDI